MKRNMKILEYLSLMLVVTLLVGLISFSMVSQLSESVARAEADASVVLDCLTEAPIYFGDTVELYATISGISSKYTLEWQYNDGEHGWHVLEDVSGVSYKYIVTEENVDFGYRVVAYIKADNVPEEELEALYGEKTEPVVNELPGFDDETEVPAGPESEETATPAETDPAEAMEISAAEPVITEAPAATEAPKVEPVVTEAPAETETPKVEPVVTEIPAATEAPGVESVVTEAPAITEAPKVEPVVTEAPTETQKTESEVPAAEQKQETADRVPATEEQPEGNNEN